MVSATTGSVPIADLAQAPLELSRLFTNIPVPVTPGWQGNAVDTVSWADHVLYYQSVQYAIAAARMQINVGAAAPVARMSRSPRR